MVEVVIATTPLEAVALAVVIESEEADGKETGDDSTVEVHVVEVTVEKERTGSTTGDERVTEMLDAPGATGIPVDLETGKVDCTVRLICGEVLAVEEGDAKATSEEDKGRTGTLDDPGITRMLVDLENGEVDCSTGPVCGNPVEGVPEATAEEERMNGMLDDAGITGTLDDFDAGKVG
ncbi:hypothetical protein PVAR5_1570 [Paecilomyces variotii No. 5]|uniref:Uncharacterized protein n=1 Tax=Byssochlamys spectabilis (strain No. 5 / NBRC 109023) TaxID=1356009 RepID=V5FTF7_BYSSN|nr:hypothetical protein PVAR5_1570 [Paecilomyces variotii No. 5]